MASRLLVALATEEAAVQKGEVEGKVVVVGDEASPATVSARTVVSARSRGRRRMRIAGRAVCVNRGGIFFLLKKSKNKNKTKETELVRTASKGAADVRSARNA